MSDEIDDGGTAFPAEGIASLGSRFCTPGMSLRDWFAGQALASSSNMESGKLTLAKWAYEMADEMIAERNKHADK